MTEKRYEAFTKALDDLNKAWMSKTKNTDRLVGLINEMSADVEKFSSGSLVVDNILGGGFAKGRVIEVYGPEACLFEDTFIQYETIRKDTKERINHKGGTIKKLYERFKNVEGIDKRSFNRQYKAEDLEYKVSSINEEDCIFTNEVLDVVKSGKKECFEVTAKIKNKEYKIQASKDHKFYVGDGKYKPLEDLNEGDFVFIHDSFRNKKGIKKTVRAKEILTKNHPDPKCTKKTVNGKYEYYRNYVYKLVVEAYMNDLTLDEYIEVLNSDDLERIKNLKYVDSSLYDIHHVDGDRNNNSIENLEILKKSDHYRHHALENHNNLRFIAKPAEIVSIENKGVKETYDIRCYSPYNNYVANNFVVHNSGKTSMALTALGNVQREGGNCVFIDVEQALDPVYAQKLGVNLDKLGFAQPSIAEEVIALALALIKTGNVDLIVIDSVAAMMSKDAYEKEVGEVTVASLARLLSQNLPKLVKACREYNCAVIFINQVRDNVGVMWGPKTTTPGGKALKFYASQRLEVKRKGKVEETVDGEKVIIGNEVEVKVVKNKVAPPFKQGTTILTFNKGINKEAELFSVAEELGIIRKVGQRFYIEPSDKLDYNIEDEGMKIATYQANARKQVEEDKKLQEVLTERIQEKFQKEKDSENLVEEEDNEDEE